MALEAGIASLYGTGSKKEVPRHVWQIRVAMAEQRACRRILFPAATALMAFFTCFMLLSYITDTGFQEAIDVVLSSKRTLIFENVDIAAVKNQMSRWQNIGAKML